MNFKYAIYVRKSQESKERQVLSLESQKTELSEYAKSHDLKIVRIFEESHTAFKPGRPVFAEMMGLIDEGAINAVVVWKPDRIARNAQDGGRFIQAIDDGKIQELRTPYELYKQSDNRIMLYIQFGMSNDFSRQISANVKRGNRAKYARGEYPGRAPTGYLNAKVGLFRNIIPDPLLAPLIKKFFKEYSTGEYSFEELSKLAKKWGLTYASGNKLSKSNVQKIINNSLYYGLFHHGGESHEGSYEPLITKELYDKCQKVMKMKGKPRKSNWEHDFKGVMTCKECGCAITAETKIKHYQRTGNTAIYTYYRCTKRRGKCSQPAQTEEEIKNQFKEIFKSIYIDKETRELAHELLHAHDKSEVSQNKNWSQSIKLKINSIEKDIKELSMMRARHEISQEELADLKMDLLKEKIALKEQLKKIEIEESAWLEPAKECLDACHFGVDTIENGKPEEKRELIRKVGSNLFLEQKIIGLSLEQPFDVLQKREVRENVQG